MVSKLWTVVAIAQTFLLGIAESFPLWIGGLRITFASIWTGQWKTSKLRFYEAFFQLTLLNTFVFINPFYKTFKFISDHLSVPIPLNKTQRKMLRESTLMLSRFKLSNAEVEALLDQIELVYSPSLMGTIALGNATACCIETTIYVHESQHHRISPSTLRHEVVHALQFNSFRNKGKELGFLSVYFAQYLAALLTNGFDPTKAYHSIDAEVEAYKMEKNFNTVSRINDKTLFREETSPFMKL
eukprot:TRINITY_DN8766_c0_g1_i2.p1 TRINITY_DN8766_c0_g1~~TRINITY_DN8766_c0_g1_i2.p1  ORF type:complete len:242 (+),score=55.19 TRINITY_DN8766_c0_g1_i2:78-803(+)